MTNSHSIKITMSSPEEIGKAIQKQRKAQKITQKEFAQQLGKSARPIQKYESDNKEEYASDRKTFKRKV